jgi:hypothetical protein
MKDIGLSMELYLERVSRNSLHMRVWREFGS